MKRLAVVLSCCALTMSASAALAGPASSSSGVYVSGKLGFAVVPDLTATGSSWTGTWNDDISFNTGMAINGAIGYEFAPFRTEFELGYQKNDADYSDGTEIYRGIPLPHYRYDFADGNVNTTTYMANGYYDFKLGNGFTPYLGAGLGLATVKLSDMRNESWHHSYGDSDTVFAYQFMIGASYALDKNWALDLSYRYVGTANSSSDNGWGTKTDFEFYSHNFLLGGRYTF